MLHKLTANNMVTAILFASAYGREGDPHTKLDAFNEVSNVYRIN